VAIKPGGPLRVVVTISVAEGKHLRRHVETAGRRPALDVADG
jgi:hypothetical protein